MVWRASEAVFRPYTMRLLIWRLRARKRRKKAQNRILAVQSTAMTKTQQDESVGAQLIHRRPSAQRRVSATVFRATWVVVNRSSRDTARRHARESAAVGRVGTAGLGKPGGEPSLTEETASEHLSSTTCRGHL